MMPPFLLPLLLPLAIWEDALANCVQAAMLCLEAVAHLLDTSVHQATARACSAAVHRHSPPALPGHRSWSCALASPALTHMAVALDAHHGHVSPSQ